MTEWNARRILSEICDGDRRRRVLTTFWKRADPQSRALTIFHLAKALHFREETIKKFPPERKAELLASRMGAPELEDSLEMALMLYHTTEAKTLMATMLDRWKIPHTEGSIEIDEYDRPSAEEVRATVLETADAFDRVDVMLYLATAGLLMGEKWREATWPVVEELRQR